MALAILELLELEKGVARFKIDTGTNAYYRLKIGRSVGRRSGIDWVDNIYLSTPVAKNKRSGDLFDSSADISVPVTHIEKESAYVQLFSFKSPDGKSPAFSRVLRVPTGFGVPIGSSMDLCRPFSTGATMKTGQAFQTPRRVPCRSCAEVYARQASVEDLLAGILKAAAPLVLKLMGSAQNDARQFLSPGAAGSTAKPGQGEILAQLLNSILGSVGGKALAGSQAQSLLDPAERGNRFINKGNGQFSRPFFWQALLGAAIGPLIQALPQLMNVANQQRIQLKQSDNKLITDILSDVNRRMLLQQLLQAQREAPSSGQPGNAAELNQLMQLLQQAAAGAAPPSPVAVVPAAKSMFLNAAHSSALSSKALLSFETSSPLIWNGMEKVLFTRGCGIRLKVRFNVSGPAPAGPLTKSILKVVFKDSSNQSVWSEKTFKQKYIQPNSIIELVFAPDELVRLPVNTPISVFAEMRWLNKAGKEYKALGSSEVVIVGKYFLREQGSYVSAERELTDMKRFRPFWNKVWEAPSLDAAAGNNGDKKYLWELDVDAKYSVLISAEQESNGLMETKILHGEADEESIAQKTEGRMKAGIELSVKELNRLLPLWDGETALDSEKLEAFTTNPFSRNNAGEFICNFKLKGRAGERGAIWVVPVFKLLESTLNTIQRTDDTGQVLAVAEEKVRFPLPVSARVIGLKSRK